MKRILYASSAALALACASACSDVITVEDSSFVFTGRQYTADMDRCISLSLEEGCPLQKYTMTYLIDGDPILHLLDEHGNEVKSGSTQDFGAGPRAWVLPLLRRGPHKVSFTLSSEDYSFSLDVPFEVDDEPFTVHGEVRTDMGEDTSTLLLSLSEGIADKEYHGYVHVDGECVDEDGFRVNFKEAPIFSVAVPLLRPGSHRVLVEVSDGYTSEELDFLFEEPLRYPDLQVELSRSTSTGRTRFMVRSNPYSLSVAVHDSLVVRGRCDYHVCSPYEDRTDYRTAYKEVCDISQYDRFVPVVGRWYDLTDTGSKEDGITSQSIANSTWSSRWFSSGDGGYEYVQVPDGYSFYEIESSAHHLSMDFETLIGVTVHVANSERDVILNGTPIGETYSYRLTASSR